MRTELNQQNKKLVKAFWRALDDPEVTEDSLRGFLAEDIDWHGHDPVNDLRGIAAFVGDFWQPLQRSIDDLTRETFVFMGGSSNGRIDGSGDGRMWVSGTGVLRGTFTHDYLGIPASGKTVSIRWGEFCCIENGRISRIYFLLDLIDLIEQAGIRVLPKSRGKEGVYPPPALDDGVLEDAQDEQTSNYSLAHIRKFIFDGLNNYDQSNLKSMGMADFFDAGVKWYGPGGIGACTNFREFETLHQQPWLEAFPDRAVQDLDALIAEGVYSGGPGWSGVIATHSGQYLDCPATGNKIRINGLDWWKRDGEQYVENWVFVDMIHLFRQFGVDLLARIHPA